MSAVIFFDFAETQNVAPSDRVGTLGDLGFEAPLQPAIAVQGWTGGGRDFTPASSHGFVAYDNDEAVSLLTRDVTIQAILSVDLASDAGPMTVLARGTDGSASEYYAYGLELEAAATAGDVDVRWFWADLAGTIHTAAAGTFTSPGDNVSFLITATRRWEGTGRVVCRYYAADHLLAEVVSTAGDIGGGTTGHTSVGARKTAGTWGRFFSGVIEQLGVYDYEMPLEEIEATWARLSRYQPEGVARFRASSPLGAPWSRDPSSVIGKLIRVFGQLAGGGASLAEEMGDILPDRASDRDLARWEYLLAKPPLPLDSLDTRRARVLSLIQRENGLSLPIVKKVLAPVLDVAEDAVDIREFANRIDDPWDSIRAERWHDEGGVFSSVSGKLRVLVPSASTRPFGLASQRGHLITSIVEGDHGQPANGNGTWCEIKIDSVTSWPSNDAVAGLYWFDFITDDRIWIGVSKVGANYVLAHRRKVAGVLSTITVLHTFGASLPTFYLRTRRTATATSMLVEWSTTSFAAGLSTSTITCPPSPAWVGVGVGVDGTLDADLTIILDDFATNAPQGRRPYSWYAYRNLALPGSPDIVGARQLVARYKHAHMHADAVTTMSVLCDNNSSPCDGGPLGGI